MKWPVQTYTLEKTFPIPRNRVWELLSDTDHLNRMIGLFSVQVMNPSAGSGGLYRELMAKAAGVIPVRWSEAPFEWEKGTRYAVTREYKSGPLKLFYGGVELSDAYGGEDGGERGTLVKLFGEFTPSNPIGIAAIPITGRGAMWKTMKYLEYCVRQAEQGQGEIVPQPSPGSAIHMKELERLVRELKQCPVHTRLADQLQEHLIRSGDDGVVDMRPYELAAAWGASREETLRMFLFATRAGIMNLSWHLICPNCRVSKSQTETLSKLTAQFHCDFCGINYRANFDRYVELCFTVHTRIRQASKQLFCIGGPKITPHIHAQVYLQPGESAPVSYPQDHEEYRFRVLKCNDVLEIKDEFPASPVNRLVYTDSGWSVGSMAAPSPGSQLTVVNESNQAVVIALEKCEWDHDKVTAAKVTTMHEFRGMFSSEVLAPGQQVGVESVTLFFSDLLGSTVFYEQVGDAQAYGKVRRHFDFMMEWIHRNQGTLVKTIGDAVMAIFEKPEHGVRAALDIQRHIASFNASLSGEEPIVIKIGLHYGPAIAVNSNDRMDYFGRTVNIAARIQGQSRGGDIILSEACIRHEEVEEVLASYGVERHTFNSRLKGIEDAVMLTRLELLDSGDSVRVPVSLASIDTASGE